jgi:hypothetical protein
VCFRWPRRLQQACRLSAHHVQDAVGEQVLDEPEMAELQVGPGRAGPVRGFVTEAEVNVSEVASEGERAVAAVVDVVRVHQAGHDRQCADEERNAKTQKAAGEKAAGSTATVRTRHEDRRDEEEQAHEERAVDRGKRGQYRGLGLLLDVPPVGRAVCLCGVVDDDEDGQGDAKVVEPRETARAGCVLCGGRDSVRRGFNTTGIHAYMMVNTRTLRTGAIPRPSLPGARSSRAAGVSGWLRCGGPGRRGRTSARPAGAA